MQIELPCPACNAPIPLEELLTDGIVVCRMCNERFHHNQVDAALTFVDEIPETEYLGG